MQFKLATLITTTLTVTSVSATIQAKDIVSNIDDLSITSIFSAVPKGINNFREIVTNVGDAVTMLTDAKGDKIDSKDDQLSICDAFTGFVKVHQALLETLIGKAVILSSTPFTAPIAAVLRAIEGGVDDFASSLIGFVPTCADEAKEEKMKLDKTLDDAIDNFA